MNQTNKDNNALVKLVQFWKDEDNRKEIMYRVENRDKQIQKEVKKLEKLNIKNKLETTLAIIVFAAICFFLAAEAIMFLF